MQLTLPMPLMFRGIPRKKKTEELYVHAMKEHTIDVPEYSAGEFDCASDQIYCTLNRVVFPNLKSRNGSLYRPFMPRKGSSEIPNASFIDNDWISETKKLSQNPINRDTDFSTGSFSYPIHMYMKWWRSLHGYSTERNWKIWPKNLFPDIHHSPEGNVPKFEEALSSLTSFNGEDISKYDRMHEVQAEKLVLIDNEWWIKTNPPCISVSQSMSKNHPAKENVEVFFEYLPDYQDLNFNASRFPIFKFDEALEYAKQLEVKLHTKYKDMADMPAHLTAPISNLELFNFDQEEDELFKFSFVLASNIVRRSVQHDFHKIHEDSPPLFEGDRFDAFQKIKNELYATNMLMGEKGDLCHMATDIVELWESIRKPTYEGLGRPSKGFKIMNDKLADLIDDQVINIGNSIPMKF